MGPGPGGVHPGRKAGPAGPIAGAFHTRLASGAADRQGRERGGGRRRVLAVPPRHPPKSPTWPRTLPCELGWGDGGACWGGPGRAGGAHIAPGVKWSGMQGCTRAAPGLRSSPPESTRPEFTAWGLKMLHLFLRGGFPVKLGVPRNTDGSRLIQGGRAPVLKDDATSPFLFDCFLRV